VDYLYSVWLYPLNCSVCQSYIYIPSVLTFTISATYRVHLCVLFGSENEKYLFPYTESKNLIVCTR
jgi:hypothetical protein